MNEFVPQRTAAYISQYDLHIGEMTVRETLAFSARCQGVGSRYGRLFNLRDHSFCFQLSFIINFKMNYTMNNLQYRRMTIIFEICRYVSRVVQKRKGCKYQA
jgi:hypothetical protein